MFGKREKDDKEGLRLVSGQDFRGRVPIKNIDNKSSLRHNLTNVKNQVSSNFETTPARLMPRPPSLL